MSHYRNKNRLTVRDLLKIGVLSTLLTILIMGTCLFLLVSGFFGFFESQNSNRVVDRVLSPDGEYQAITFFRCGFDDRRACVPQASILSSGEALRTTDRGNIFIGSIDVVFKDMQWLSERKLLIVYTGDYPDIPALQVNQKGDIQIEYQFVEAE